jgi:hypothetical protein
LLHVHGQAQREDEVESLELENTLVLNALLSDQRLHCVAFCVGLHCVGRVHRFYHLPAVDNIKEERKHDLKVELIHHKKVVVLKRGPLKVLECKLVYRQAKSHQNRDKSAHPAEPVQSVQPDLELAQDNESQDYQQEAC